MDDYGELRKLKRIIDHFVARGNDELRMIRIAAEELGVDAIQLRFALDMI